MNQSAIDLDGMSRPFWVRMFHTPLGDLVRLRITSRLDLKGLIASSGLPESLGKIVSEVCRRTRLWRIEKIDVARELIGHFSDGLAAGETPGQLIDSFGDPKQAAGLIRRAKRRGRPFIWRAYGHGMQAAKWSFAVAFVLYLGLWGRFIWSRPNISWNYVAELNAAAVAVPRDQRAWPVYRDALLKFKPVPDDLTVLQQAGGVDDSGGEKATRLARFHKLIGSLPGDEHWDALVAHLEENEEALELIRQAAARPKLGFVYRDAADAVEAPAKFMAGGGRLVPNEEANPMVIHLHLQHIVHLRSLASLLRGDALRTVASGDGETASADLAAILRMADHVRDAAPFLVTELVAIKVLNMACETIGQILVEWPQSLSDEQLKQLAHRVAAFAGGGRIQMRLDGERAFHRDIWQRIYTDDGNGDGHLTAEGYRLLRSVGGNMIATAEEPLPDRLKVHLAGSALAAVIANRREMAEFCDHLMDQVQREHSRPLWELEWSAAEAELRELSQSPATRFRYMPAFLVLPAVVQTMILGERATQTRDAALVVIALELYRRRHGAWPQRLEQLTPDLLPAVPPDRFDGEPLRYRVVDSHPVLYSIGTDRVDDGGVPPEDPNGDASRWHPPGDVVERYPQDTGDWILWPAD